MTTTGGTQYTIQCVSMFVPTRLTGVATSSWGSPRRQGAICIRTLRSSFTFICTFVSLYYFSFIHTPHHSFVVVHAIARSYSCGSFILIHHTSAFGYLPALPVVCPSWVLCTPGHFTHEQTPIVHLQYPAASYERMNPRLTVEA